jgi:hypothetical protein
LLYRQVQSSNVEHFELLTLPEDALVVGCGAGVKAATEDPCSRQGHEVAIEVTQHPISLVEGADRQDRDDFIVYERQPERRSS